MKTQVSLIVAMARGGVIGHQNALPWHLSADLVHFKRTTTGKPVIMGRKTFDSIVMRLGKPLPLRRNIVITRQHNWHYDGVESAHSLDEALAMCATEPEVFVIGGEQIYTSAMPHADRLIVTEIDAAFAGDAFFPIIDTRQWHEIERATHIDTQTQLPYAFVIYQKK